METAYYILNNNLSRGQRLLLIAVFITGSAVNMALSRRRKRANPLLLSILYTYILFILLITLINRTPADFPRAKWIPLWSWYEAAVSRNKELFKEILLNIFLFVPPGLIFRLLSETKQQANRPKNVFRPAYALLPGFMLSAFIETTQLITCRGLFEWDDMFGNSLGWLTGYAVGCLIIKTPGD